MGGMTPGIFTGSKPGLVPNSAGGTTNFLRADGQYAVPPGSGGNSSNTFPLALVSQTDVYLTNYQAGAFIATALVANKLWLHPIFVSQAFTATKIGVQLTTNGATNVRLGIYSPRSNTDPLPGLLVIDAGSLSLSSGAPSVKTLTISQLLNPGLYWICILADAASTTVINGFTEGATSFGVKMITGTIASVSGISRTQAFGALPANESAQTYSVESNAHVIGIR